jgi:hypothetical protein
VVADANQITFYKNGQLGFQVSGTFRGLSATASLFCHSSSQSTSGHCANAYFDNVFYLQEALSATEVGSLHAWSESY